MPTVVLVRHGRTTANASGVLAGRTAGVRLDDTGQGQVDRAGERLAAVPLSAVVTSPMERCRQTAEAILTRQTTAPELAIEAGLDECDYGDWQGQKLKDLAQDDLWKVVQSAPSSVTFPGGESMATMQRRAVEAVRRIDAEQDEHAVWAAVSHGDIIKSVLADALGMHLDLFQRITVDPASISIVRYGTGRPHVAAMNTHAGDLSWLVHRPQQDGASDDAAVGGGAGPSTPS